MSSSKRGYDSSRRRVKAKATRSRVVRAAGELFVDQGFAGTSIREIAARADVSQETVYAAFGSKAEVLMRWLDVQVVGDEEPVPLIDRPWVGAMGDEPTLDGRLAILGEHGSAATIRAAPAVRVLRAAAASDPQLAEMLAEGQRRRHEDNATLCDLLAGEEPLRDACSRDEAVDWLWTITSDELYTALVEDRRWTVELYREWIGLTIRTTLFGL